MISTCVMGICVISLAHVRIDHPDMLLRTTFPAIVCL